MATKTELEHKVGKIYRIKDRSLCPAQFRSIPEDKGYEEHGVVVTAVFPDHFGKVPPLLGVRISAPTHLSK